MNLTALIASFRIDADDNVSQKFLWPDVAVTAWLNEAVQQACIRARLLHESSNPEICRIAVTAGVSTYPLHESLYEIDYMAFAPADDARRWPVKQISREDLDSVYPDWRECTGRVEYAIQGDTGVRLAFTPATDGTLYLEGFRLPLDEMTVDTADTDIPEINAAHHIHLVQWALYRAFSVPDAEAIDKDRAALAERAFTAYFGAHPGNDLRRLTRQDTVHHNRMHWA